LDSNAQLYKIDAREKKEPGPISRLAPGLYKYTCTIRLFLDSGVPATEVGMAIGAPGLIAGMHIFKHAALAMARQATSDRSRNGEARLERAFGLFIK
jgi:hypothetical protein